MGGVCNVATGRIYSLLELIDILSGCVNQSVEVVHHPVREGDIPFSETEITRLQSLMSTKDFSSLNKGLSALLRYTSTNRK